MRGIFTDFAAGKSPRAIAIKLNRRAVSEGRDAGAGGAQGHTGGGDEGSGREEPVLLHPGLADVYRRKAETLTEALNEEGLRTEAAESLRPMIQAIRLVPESGELAIELVGELAGILAMTNEKNPRPFGPRVRQLTLVAGERSQCHYAHLSSYFVISSLTPAAA